MPDIKTAVHATMFVMFWLILIIILVIAGAAVSLWLRSLGLGPALAILKRFAFIPIDHWRGALMISGPIVLIVILLSVFRGCRTPNKPLDIDPAAINKINTANEADRKAELGKVIQKNADTITTVDKRNTINEQADETTRQAEIYNKVQEADAKIAEAKKQGHDVTGPELECILNPTPENCK